MKEKKQINFSQVSSVIENIIYYAILIPLVIVTLMIFVCFDLITFSMFGDMMFAETFLSKETCQKIYDFLSKK